MSKLNRKRKSSKRLAQAKPIAVVLREYTQFNVPDMYIQDVSDALSAAILSDHYAQILRLERVTEDSGNEE